MSSLSSLPCNNEVSLEPFYRPHRHGSSLVVVSMSSSSSFQDPNLPILDSISNMLMEEGMEDDATCKQQQDDDASYQAIFHSFYDIIGEHLPPKSSVFSTSSENLFDLLIPHDKQHAMCYNGFNILTHQMLNSGTSIVTLPNAVSPQDYDAAIKFNDGQLIYTKVSCLKKDKGLNDFRSFTGRGSNAHLPSPYKEFSLKLAGVELSFEDLKIHGLYEDLYVREPSIRAPITMYGNKGKALAVAGNGGKSGKKRTAEYLDFKESIVNCAEAVAVGDVKAANELLRDIWHVHGASADGDGSQRAAHYFSEALVARMRGTGSIHVRAILHDKPSAVAILKSHKMCFEVSPLMKTTHYFANQSILKAAEQASRLHVVDYGFEGGMQFPFLINALADQKGGPPLLVVTGINFPQPGNNPAGRLEESGRRLAEHARTYNVPFQYHAIVSSKWEDLDSSSFHFHEDEVLVVNCIKSLRHLADESVDLVSPRQKFLICIHGLKPHLLITADVSAGYSSSFFVTRFREALYYYYNVFDMVDTLWGDSPERRLKERSLYSDILNIVGCEGVERVDRAETYKQWQVRIKRAGFKQLPIPPEILSRSRSHMKQHYHKDFFVHDEANKWMLLGWRGRTSVAISAWKLSDAP